MQALPACSNDWNETMWTDGWKIGAAMLAGGRQWSETMAATQSVMTHRTGTIDAALRNPFHADVAELNRMVPEKIAAFGKSGETIIGDLVDIQADMVTQAADVMRLCWSGWPPSGAAMERIAGRGSRIAVKMASASGRALAPIHAAVTGNQRRLDRKR